MVYIHITRFVEPYLHADTHADRYSSSFLYAMIPIVTVDSRNKPRDKALAFKIHHRKGKEGSRPSIPNAERCSRLARYSNIKKNGENDPVYNRRCNASEMLPSHTPYIH